MKLAKILVFSLILLLVATSAFAQGDELPKPGMTPDHPLYFAKTIIEELRVIFTIDSGEKVLLYVKFAQVKVAEAKVCIRKDKLEAAEEALTRYRRYIKQAQQSIDQALDEGRDVTKAIAVVEEVTAKHTEVLTGLLDKVPEQAREAIKHAIEVSKKGRNTALERLRRIQSGELPGDSKESKKHLGDVGREAEVGKSEVEEQKKNKPEGKRPKIKEPETRRPEVKASSPSKGNCSDTKRP